MTQLRQLQPGARFMVPDLGITGRLISANECRCRVRLDGPGRVVSFRNRRGNQRLFIADSGRATDWTPSVDVQILRDD